MSRLLRTLIFFLAILPAIWGNCPGALTGICCCESASADGAVGSAAKPPCCPLCRERDEKSRRTPCSHCPCVMARNGSAPAPAAVGAPVPDLTVIVPVCPADAEPVVFSAAFKRGLDIRPPGGPPDLVGTVVLLV